MCRTCHRLSVKRSVYWNDVKKSDSDSETNGESIILNIDLTTAPIWINVWKPCGATYRMYSEPHFQLRACNILRCRLHCDYCICLCFISWFLCLSYVFSYYSISLFLSSRARIWHLCTRFRIFTGTCSMADLVFVLDSSGSLGIDNWKKVLTFVTGIIVKLSIGPLDSRVGVVYYGSSATLGFHLNTHQQKQDIIDAVMGRSRDIYHNHPRRHLLTCKSLFHLVNH